MAIGRPRAFDTEAALDQALNVFREKGYEGASLADLTAAMGINPPSLYAAFGNKQALFGKALDRYAEKQAGFYEDALSRPTAREAVEALLAGAVDMATDAKTPRGCLLVSGALACGEEADPVRDELARRRREGEQALRRRLERAKAEGDLPADAHPADLARYVTTVLQGLAVQAAGGAKRADLRRVADLALRTWPG